MSGAETGRRSSFAALLAGCVGVVFGDIGTSPLYALKETFAGHHPLPLDAPHVLGVLSLVFWSILLVVSLKYVILMMRADNRGEGGSLSLLALVTHAAAGRPRLLAVLATLGIFAAALFYGDAMITPAISVLSAMEGLEVAAPDLGPFVLPLTLGVLVVLFAVQRHGTALMGRLFGPVMILWFLVLAILGIKNIHHAPWVLAALSPHHAVLFFWDNGLAAFLALGSVVLAVTGAEALYADMGHFGRWPIRLAWYFLVLPSLVLNYFGQGALILAHPEAIASPFFHMASEWARLPLVILATLATVIASQAVITGSFSLTRQAVQLGLLPRLRILHTSDTEIGQIYIPFVNWGLGLCVMLLVVGFQSSSNLAAAYGIAVTGTMLISTLMLGFVGLLLWRWSRRKTAILTGLFLAADLAYFSATATKIPDGGWFPLAVGVVVFLLLTTWQLGRQLLLATVRREVMSLPDFLVALSDDIPRVEGTAVFLTAAEGVPLAMLHNLKHNKVLHRRVVLLTARVADCPQVPQAERIEAQLLAPGIHRVILHFGFMEDPNIPRALANASSEQLGFFYEPMSVSYFLTRETLLLGSEGDLPAWRKRLFAWMNRSAAGAMEFFHLPSNRVVELGSQIKI